VNWAINQCSRILKKDFFEMQRDNDKVKIKLMEVAWFSGSCAIGYFVIFEDILISLFVD
jgi:hypothetical protein